MKIRFLRHAASDGCNRLVSALGDLGHNVLRIKLVHSQYSGARTHLVVNWGRSDYGTLRAGLAVLNKPEAVDIVSDKLKFFSHVSGMGLGHNVPKWCTTKAQAERYIRDELDVVYARTLTRSSEGRGIEVCTQVSEIPTAPLYTCKVDVDREVRIHIFDGEVIDYAQKKRMGSERREAEGIEVNDDIRNTANGWVFAREGVSIPQLAKDVATEMVRATGLDFGAVDLIITPQGVPKVLEINSAPGLEGTTVDRYAHALDRYASR